MLVNYAVVGWLIQVSRLKGNLCQQKKVCCGQKSTYVPCHLEDWSVLLDYDLSFLTGTDSHVSVIPFSHQLLGFQVILKIFVRGSLSQTS